MFIQNEYFLEIECILDGIICMPCGGCCGKYPKLTLPIEIASHNRNFNNNAQNLEEIM